MSLDPYLVPLTKINSKGIKNLHLRPDTKRLIWKKLLDIGLGDGPFYMIPSTSNESKNQQVDCIKLKRLCTAEETMK